MHCIKCSNNAKQKHFTSGLSRLEPVHCSACSWGWVFVFVQGEGRHMERAALIGVCPLHLLSSLLTVSGCLKHSCQWSSVSPPIHHQSCLLCNYSSPGFCSAPNLEAALWCARARPSFRGPEFTRPGSRSPPYPFFFSHWGPEVCWSTKPWKRHN